MNYDTLQTGWYGRTEADCAERIQEISAEITGTTIFLSCAERKLCAGNRKKWNVRDNEDHKGYVTKFEVADDYCSQFELHTVGSSRHQELWIPADALESFNQHIIGTIKVIGAFSDNSSD